MYFFLQPDLSAKLPSESYLMQSPQFLLSISLLCHYILMQSPDVSSHFFIVHFLHLLLTVATKLSSSVFSVEQSRRDVSVVNNTWRLVLRLLQTQLTALTWWLKPLYNSAADNSVLCLFLKGLCAHSTHTNIEEKH